MKQNTSLEDRLEAFGTALRGRPPLTDRVMDQVRKSAADGATKEPSRLAPSATTRRRRQLVTVAAGAVATISAAVLIAIVLLPSPSVGWADVTKAVQSQKWIRGISNGGRTCTMWLSHERQISAFIWSEDWFRFSDGRERAKYEYYRGGKRITKVPLGEEDAERVLPLGALLRDKGTIGPWLFGTKVLTQKRREVTEAGKTWIEFQMVLSPGRENLNTLRVDPETKLPVYLLVTSPEDATDSVKWLFDYPADGPTDIYKLGVPREIKIDDRMPSPDAQRALDAMAASRAQLGDFRLMVAEQEDSGDTLIVCRKGDRWRIDKCVSSDRPKPTKGRNLSDWFAERLEGSQRIPSYVCDGKTVYEKPWGSDGENIHWQTSRYHAPQDLMSSKGESNLTGAPYAKLFPLVYPDLTPDRGTRFEFDPQPVESPGCVVIKRSVLLTDGSLAHVWSYIDPRRGHAVVRAEVFTLPPDAPASPDASSDRQSVRMEDFQQSPHGFWYPTVVHDTPPQEVTTTVRYHFDFDANLPDSLFTIDDAQVTKP